MKINPFLAIVLVVLLLYGKILRTPFKVNLKSNNLSKLRQRTRCLREMTQKTKSLWSTCEKHRIELSSIATGLRKVSEQTAVICKRHTISFPYTDKFTNRDYPGHSDTETIQ